MVKFFVAVLLATLAAARPNADERESEKVKKTILTCCDETNFSIMEVQKSFKNITAHPLCESDESKAWVNCFCNNLNRGKNDTSDGKEIPPDMMQCVEKLTSVPEEDRNCAMVNCAVGVQQKIRMKCSRIIEFQPKL